MDGIGVLDIDTRPPPAPSGTATGSAAHASSIESDAIMGETETAELDTALSGAKTISMVSTVSTTTHVATSPATNQVTTYSSVSGASVWCVVVGCTMGVILLVFAAMFYFKRKKREKRHARDAGRPRGERTGAER
jgi:hypothetical protein